MSDCSLKLSKVVTYMFVCRAGLNVVSNGRGIMARGTGSNIGQAVLGRASSCYCAILESPATWWSGYMVVRLHGGRQLHYSYFSQYLTLIGQCVMIRGTDWPMYYDTWH